MKRMQYVYSFSDEREVVFKKLHLEFVFAQTIEAEMLVLYHGKCNILIIHTTLTRDSG